MKRFRMVLLALLMCSSLVAGVTPVMDLQLFHVLGLRDTDVGIADAHTFAGKASLSLKSSDTGNVRGDVAVSFTEFGGIPALSIDRAYLRARFPKWRLTIGKTRTGWGDGMLFNAADLLFGSIDTDVDMKSNELRSTTQWLTSAQLPLGDFSFLEAVIIPSQDVTDLSIRNMSAGLRYYTTIGTMKLEGGAAYRKDNTPAHDTGMVLTPYIALQGNIGPDWYVSTSANLPYPEAIGEELEDSWLISGGLLHMVSVGWRGTLSLRLEALVRPFGSWTPSLTKDLAIFVYPEITYAPEESYSFTFRSIFSPIDLSAMITLGASWNVFQGFSVQGFITANAGETNDQFSWKSNTATETSLGIMAGVSWVY